MSIQQIDQVFWYQKRNSMVVTYRDGKADRMPASVFAAATLAEDARLVLVSTRPGIVRWVRDPEFSCPTRLRLPDTPRRRASAHARSGPQAKV